MNGHANPIVPRDINAVYEMVDTATQRTIQEIENAKQAALVANPQHRQDIIEIENLFGNQLQDIYQSQDQVQEAEFEQQRANINFDINSIKEIDKCYLQLKYATLRDFHHGKLNKDQARDCANQSKDHIQRILSPLYRAGQPALDQAAIDAAVEGKKRALQEFNDSITTGNLSRFSRRLAKPLFALLGATLGFCLDLLFATHLLVQGVHCGFYAVFGMLHYLSIPYVDNVIDYIAIPYPYFDWHWALHENVVSHSIYTSVHGFFSASPILPYRGYVVWDTIKTLVFSAPLALLSGFAFYKLYEHFLQNKVEHTDDKKDRLHSALKNHMAINHPEPEPPGLMQRFLGRQP